MPISTNSSIPKQKPGHKRGKAGVYDEIDYDLDPRTQNSRRIKHNETVPTDTLKEDGKIKKKKIIIGVVIVGLFIGAIGVGIVLALPGRFILALCLYEFN